MSDGMVIRKALVRILDPDRRLVIDRGFVKAPEEFFEKYGPRFSGEQPTGKNAGNFRVIEKWANRSRAAEAYDENRRERLRARKELDANSNAAANPTPQPPAPAVESAPEAEKPKDNLLPPEKAIWRGTKKTAKKKE